MKTYIKLFCEQFTYPQEAVEVIMDGWDKISENKETIELFENVLERFFKKQFKDGKETMAALSEISELTGVHEYTINLIFYICASKTTKELYKEKGISEEIFNDTVSDLKWKLMECHQVHNIWGTFVGWWQDRMFLMTCFALKRLQFEKIEFPYEEYKFDGGTIKKGEIVLNVHIPSCGPLTEQLCQESYEMAVKFFGEELEGKPIAFVCDSWLLFPNHKEFLPKESNILKFMDRYNIIDEKIEESKGDLWRIFYSDYTKDVNELPENTSLQRVYKKWILEGNNVGSGFGIFVAD